jgi:hypothetical protein
MRSPSAEGATAPFHFNRAQFASGRSDRTRLPVHCVPRGSLLRTLVLPQSSTTCEHAVRYVLVALVTLHCTESVCPRSPSASAGEIFASPSPMPAAFVIILFCARSDEGMRCKLVRSGSRRSVSRRALRAGKTALSRRLKRPIAVIRPTSEDGATSLRLSVPEPKDRQPGLDGIAVFAAIPTFVVALSSLDFFHPTV